MKKENLYEWEQKIDKGLLKENKNYELFEIYKQAHSELSLQQSKRDQIITIYLALCSFLLPFALGQEIIPMQTKGIIFILVGVVGMLFSYITIRYREYKEAYWLCCQTLTVLQSFKEEKLDKQTVQSAFYHCVHKKGKSCLYEKNGETRLDSWKYIKKNFLSSETFHFIIIALMCSFILALGVSLLWASLHIAFLIIVGLIVWTFLAGVYFHHCIRIYKCLEVRNGENDHERRDKAFNKVFSKAWFLHFYYDE